MFWAFIKFFSMITGILVGIHSLIYFSLIRFIPAFQIEANSRLLLIVIIILALTFPVFQLINHFFGSTMTRFFSGIAGFWFALSLYLVAIFILIWFLLAFFMLWPISVDNVTRIIQYTTLMFTATAFIFTLYGFISALSVKTTHVDVAIKNLPVSWEGKSILQISDVHLGGVWGPDRVHQVINIVRDTKPEVVVITGDLFDGGSGIHRGFIKCLSELAATNPPGGIYFTSGNHERYTSYTDSIDTIKKANITLLENDVVNIHGLQIVGVQYPDLRTLKSDKAGADEFDIQKHPGYKKGRPTVLLYHTPTDFQEANFDLADIQRKAYISPETNFENAKAIGIDLQLSGHTHAGQFFPLIGITRKIYNGYHYGLHRSGDFQIYISSGAGTWGPPIRHTIPCEVALLKLHKGS